MVWGGFGLESEGLGSACPFLLIRNYLTFKPINVREMWSRTSVKSLVLYEGICSWLRFPSGRTFLRELPWDTPIITLTFHLESLVSWRKWEGHSSDCSSQWLYLKEFLDFHNLKCDKLVNWKQEKAEKAYFILEDIDVYRYGPLCKIGSFRRPQSQYRDP